MNVFADGGKIIESRTDSSAGCKGVYIHISEMLNLKSEMLNLKSEMLNLKCGMLNLKYEKLNLKCEMLDPTSEMAVA